MNLSLMRLLCIWAECMLRLCGMKTRVWQRPNVSFKIYHVDDVEPCSTGVGVCLWVGLRYIHCAWWSNETASLKPLNLIY
jgi:hypothetical protein